MNLCQSYTTFPFLLLFCKVFINSKHKIINDLSTSFMMQIVVNLCDNIRQLRPGHKNQTLHLDLWAQEKVIMAKKIIQRSLNEKVKFIISHILKKIIYIFSWQLKIHTWIQIQRKEVFLWPLLTISYKCISLVILLLINVYFIIYINFYTYYVAIFVWLIKLAIICCIVLLKPLKI